MASTLSLTLTSSVSSVGLGQVWYYIATITNTGTSDTENPLTLTSTLPANVELAGTPTSTAGTVTNTGDSSNLILNIAGSIPPGATATLNIPVMIPTTATNLNNGIYYNSITYNANYTAASYTNTIDIVPMSVAKTTSTTTVAPGGTFSYTITVTNYADTPTNNPFWIYENLPQYVSLNGSPTVSQGTVTVDNNGLPTGFNTGLDINTALAPGATMTITIPVMVSTDAPAGSLAANNAGVKPDYSHLTANASATSPYVTTSPIPVITATKSASAPYANPGSTFNYMITLTNSGNAATAANYTFSDVLNANLSLSSLTSATNSAGGTVTANATSGNVTFTVSAPIPVGGSQTITIPVHVDASAPVGTLGVNTANIVPGNGGAATNSTAGTNNPVTVSQTAIPAISATKSASQATVAPGGTFNYIVTLTNSGQAPTVANYTFTDTLPSYLTLADAPTNSAGGTVTPDGDTFTVSTPIPPGGTHTITIPVNVDENAPAGALGINTVEVAPGNNGPSATSSTGTNNPPSVIVPLPVLSATKSGSSPTASPGGSFNYLLTIQNQGAVATTSNYTITDILPPNLTLAGNPTNSAGGTVSASGSTLTVSTPIPAFGSQTITIPVNVDPSAPAGPLGQNTATITPGNGGSPITSTAGSNNPPTVTSSIPIVNAIKAADTSNVQAGGTFNYLLTITNTGKVPTAANYTFIDTLPPNITLASTSGTNYTASGTTGTITFTVPTPIPAGGTQTFTIPVNIAENAPVGTFGVNSVTVMPGSGGSAATSVAGANNPPSITNVQLQVVKSASTGTVNPGGSFSYTVQITNTGQNPTASPYTFTDTLNSFLTMATTASATNSAGGLVTASSTSGDITFTVNTPIPPGETHTITIPVTVSQDATAGTLGTNSVTVQPGNGGIPFDSEPGTNNPVTVTTVAIPALDTTKSASTEAVAPGGSFNYLITINNTGKSDTVANYQITDTLPQGLTLSGTPSNDGGGSVISNTTTGTLTLTVATPIPAGGTQTITLPVTVSPNATAITPNTATIDPGNNGSVATTSPGTNNPPAISQAAPILTATKTADTTSTSPGATFNYQLTITNSGLSPTSSPYTLTETLPPGITLSGTPTNSAGGTITVTGNTLTISQPILAGATQIITLPVTVSLDATTLTPNSATIAPGNNGSPITVTEATPPTLGTPILTVSKQAAVATANRGSTFNYLITLTNTGTLPTSDPYTVTESLPAGVTYNGGASSSSGTLTYQDSTFTLAPALEPGATLTITLPVTVATTTPTGTLPNNTVTATPENGGTPTTATDITPPTITAPTLSATKTADNLLPLPGQTFNYQLLIANTGSGATLNPYTVTDTYPPYLSPLSPSNATILSTTTNPDNSTTITYQINDAIPAGGSALLTLPVTVSSTAPLGTPLPNSVTIDPQNGDPTTATTTTSPTVAGPQITATKTAGIDTINQGDTFNYTLTVTNNGNAPTTAPFTIGDPLPDNLTYAGNATSTGGTLTASGNVALTVTDALEPGQTITITIPVTVNQAAPNGQLPPNTATIYPGNNGENATATDPNPPTIPPPNLTVTKTGSPQTAAPGDTITYQVTITNTGGSTTDPFTLTDNLPTYLTGPTTLTIPQLPTGQSTTVDIQATVNDNTPPVLLNANTVTITPGNGAPDVEATDPVQTQILVPALTATKTSDTDTLYPGVTFNYLITITNTGNAPTAAPYTLTETFPPYISYLGGATSSGGGTITNQGTTFSVANAIPPGGSDTITIPVKLAQGALAGTLQPNSLIVDPGNNGSLTTATDQSPPTITTPDLAISKTADQTILYCGATFNYTLTIINNGSVPTANPFTITDQLPPTITLTGNPTSSLGTVTNSGDHSNLVLTIAGVIPAGGTGTVVIPVQVNC